MCTWYFQAEANWKFSGSLVEVSSKLPLSKVEVWWKFAGSLVEVYWKFDDTFAQNIERVAKYANWNFHFDLWNFYLNFQFASGSLMETSSKLPLNFYTLKSRSWLQPLAINILSTFSEHSLNILWTFSHHSLNILSTFSHHSLNILSTFSQHSLNPLSTFFQHPFNISSTLCQDSINTHSTSHQFSENHVTTSNMSPAFQHSLKFNQWYAFKFSETLVMTNIQHLSMFQIQIPISTTFLNTDHQNLMRVLR